MNKKRPASQLDLTKILLIVIAVLSVVLIAVICIAVGSGSQLPTTPSTGTTAPSSTATTAPSTGSTTSSVPIVLSMLSAPESGSATIQDSVLFTGTSDPAAPLTVNGKEIARDANGSFTHQVNLSLGENTITFSHKEQTLSYTITRRHVT